MLRARKNNVYAIVCSLFIHLLLFFVINASAKYAYGSVSSEVFETMDYIENADCTSTKLKQGHEINKEEPIYSYLEIVLCGEEQLKQDLVNVKQIKILKMENVMKGERKKAIVNAPAVSPKLLERTIVPCPSGCDSRGGTVLVCVLVGIDGKPEYVSTAKSSGNPIIDGAAINSCINWRFRPAQDAQGNNVRCLIYIPVGVGT